MKIEIDMREDRGSVTVRCGDRYHDELGKDEALYVVAGIFTTGKVHQWLKTKEEHEASDRAMGIIREQSTQGAA